MVSLSPIVSPAPAQTVDEMWTDSHGPVASSTAHDSAVGVIHYFGQVYTGGTSVRSGGSTEMVAFWHDGPGDPPNPVLLGQAAWPPSPRAAHAVAMGRAFDTDYSNESLIVIAGDEMRTSGFSQVVLGAFGDDWVNFEDQWEFIHADDTPHERHHVVIAMDVQEKVGLAQDTRIALLVRSLGYKYIPFPGGAELHEPDRYSVLVLERAGSSAPYNHIDTIDVGFRQVVDVRIDLEHIWVLSWGFAPAPKYQTPVLLRGYSHLDYSVVDRESSFVVSGRACRPVRLRSLYSAGVGTNNLRATSELVVVAYTISINNPSAPRDILTLRYGEDGSTWGLIWSEIYDSGFDDFPADIAAVRALTGGGQSSNNPEGVFVVGSSDNADGSYDLTTILYYDDGDPMNPVEERWVARYDPSGEDDHGIAVAATAQDHGGPLRLVAVVSGVRTNQYGHWDWLTLKYDDEPPVGDKVPTWDIHYPQNSGNSEDDDVPFAVAIVKVAEEIRAWVTGTFFRTTSGDDIGIVHYEEVFP